MKSSAVFFAVWFALACGTAQAQAYRWTDKDGKTRYGDFPPAGVKATPMKPPSGGSAPAPADKGAKGTQKPPVDPAQAFNERRQKEKEAAAKAEKERADAETRKLNCDRSQGYLRALESGQRMASMDAKGERTYLDDAGRKAQIEETRAEVAKNCK